MEKGGDEYGSKAYTGYKKLIEDVFPDWELKDDYVLQKIEPLIDSCIVQLHPRKQRVIRLNYGFADEVRQSIKKIAEGLGVTSQRVYQIRLKAFQQLRSLFRSHGLMKYFSLEMLLIHLESIEEELGRCAKRSEDQDEENQQLRRKLEEWENWLLQAPLEKITDLVKRATQGSILTFPIERLDLSWRVYRRLLKAGYRTLGDITQLTKEQLIKMGGFGKKCLQEVKDKLQAHGLALKKE